MKLHSMPMNSLQTLHPKIDVLRFWAAIWLLFFFLVAFAICAPIEASTTDGEVDRDGDIAGDFALLIAYSTQVGHAVNKEFLFVASFFIYAYTLHL